MRNSKFGLRRESPRTEAALANAAIIERLLTIQSHVSRRSCLVAQEFLPMFRVRVCFKKKKPRRECLCYSTSPLASHANRVISSFRFPLSRVKGTTCLSYCLLLVYV